MQSPTTFVDLMSHNWGLLGIGAGVIALAWPALTPIALRRRGWRAQT
jgi:hypothetical protein